MSSSCTNMKKKIPQSELKRFMNEHKNKHAQRAKKIESPLAKYLDNGQLTCNVCKCPIASEALWSSHLSSRLHKDKLASIKRKKIEAQEQERFVKPPTPPPPIISRKRSPSPENDLPPVPPKKLKSILKNPLPLKPGPSILKNAKSPQDNNVPADFFDNSENKKSSSMEVETNSEENKSKSEEKEEKMDITPNKDDPLPEGFFDDPHLDAKARNIEYKDPIEEEWEKFQKEMREETTVSTQIIAEDQDLATAERQIDEIDEQMRYWSRVIDLERKKEHMAKLLIQKQSQDNESDDSSLNEEEFTEFENLDWRAKRSFK